MASVRLVGANSGRCRRLIQAILTIAAVASRHLNRGSISTFVASGIRCPTSSASRGYQASRHRGIARFAENRMAYIAVVDVQVKEGQQEAFLQASLQNARASKREALNQRFDVLQSRDDLSKFSLVEIYRNQNGPASHKQTTHYAAWRDAVADMMAAPRSASQWDTIFPAKVTNFQPEPLILEREGSLDDLDITHVYVTVKPGYEKAFIKMTLQHARESVRERGNLRFDLLRNVEDPSQFLLIEVYRTAADAAEHKEKPHYLEWRKAIEVTDMMAKPREGKKYVSHFPNIPAAWKVAQNVQ
eukprot:TRINITY_DN28734_c0_g1_i1.p1 TRINITY_DN28734_c0_g1~~TRINITY_DN28734_c0_g1_i1.p1  ORF type:complete len:314 (-),score=65.75 TRINITY_DN28734_c0_g1_i1:65-967(-)